MGRAFRIGANTMSDAEKVTPQPQLAISLDGTGSQRTARLKAGYWYEIQAEDVAIRWTIGGSSVTADAGDPYIPAGGSRSFVLSGTVDGTGGGTTNEYIAVIHADGSTAHTAMVIPASPGAGLA